MSEHPILGTALFISSPPADRHTRLPGDVEEVHLGPSRVRCWQLLDYVLVQRRDRQSITVTKVLCDVEGWTDHRLVISKMRLRLQPPRRPQGKRPTDKLNTVLLNMPTCRHLGSRKACQPRTSALPQRLNGANYGAPLTRLPWMSSAAHVVRTSLKKMTPPSVTCSPRKTGCTEPTPINRSMPKRRSSTSVAV
ncbi:hypothetical protein SprV_0702283000 [Sparganum proliferum]